MIELAASVSTSPRIAAVAPVSAPGAVDFGLALAELLDGGGAAPIAGRRQEVAGDGKLLPEATTDENLSKDLIWLPAALMMPVPLPATVKLAMPVGVMAPSVGMVASTVVPAIVAIESAPVATPSSPAEAGAQLGEAVDLSLPSPDWAPAVAGEPKEGKAVAVKDGLVLPRGMDVVAANAPGSAASAPQSAQPQQPLLQPAGQAFATAIAVAVQAQSHRERETDARAPLAIVGAALDAVQMPAVAATADARQSALDLRQDSGLQGMIDHIEVLRDGADANDTRIRLMPDALGAVDVSVRKEGERVHVHFAAENQASARLIAEAQPRLAELAEARGIRLGDATVGSGDGSGDAHPRQPTPAAPIISAAPVSAAAPTDPITDIRIA